MSVISTGWARLDRALGGGLQRGSVVALTGDQGDGKTALAVAVLGAASGAGCCVAMVGRDDAARRAPAGVWLGHATDDRQAATMVGELARCGAVDLIVLDALEDAAAVALDVLSRRCVEGGCALLLVIRAEPWLRTPLAVSLCVQARIDLQRDGRVRVIRRGCAVDWFAPAGRVHPPEEAERRRLDSPRLGSLRRRA